LLKQRPQLEAYACFVSRVAKASPRQVDPPVDGHPDESASVPPLADRNNRASISVRPVSEPNWVKGLFPQRDWAATTNRWVELHQPSRSATLLGSATLARFRVESPAVL
jgi:hypothetical protein